MIDSEYLHALPMALPYPVPPDLPPVILADPALPLVSIVTPSLNQGTFIRATIESVLQQAYPNLEYWVIDGGSTDDTLPILKQYQHDPRIHWLSEPDNGQSDAINKGLARCRGEIFNWLCSDDILLPGALRHIVEAWTSVPQPSVIYGWVRLIDRHGSDLGYGPRQTSHLTLEKMLRSDGLPLQPATFAPTASVRALGGVDPSLHYAMDFDLHIKLIEKLPFHHVPVDLALYRMHGTSKTVALSPKFIDDVDRILRGASGRGLLPPRQAASYANLFAAQVYLTPEAWHPAQALGKLAKVIRANPSLSVPVLLMVLKGVARPMLGERNWALLRQSRVKSRSNPFKRYHLKSTHAEISDAAAAQER